MNSRLPLRILAKSTILVLLAAALWSHSGSLAIAAPGKNRAFKHRQIGPLSTTTRHRYRPSIKITSFKQTGNKAEFICDIRVRAGNIDRIEVRSGLKILGTMKIDRLINYGTFKLTPDLSKAGSGKKSIKIWAWQGRQGYQSVHGESLAVKITNP